jgi:hypothetical protein
MCFTVGVCGVCHHRITVNVFTAQRVCRRVPSVAYLWTCPQCEGLKNVSSVLSEHFSLCRFAEERFMYCMAVNVFTVGVC